MLRKDTRNYADFMQPVARENESIEEADIFIPIPGALAELSRSNQTCIEFATGASIHSLQHFWVDRIRCESKSIA
jgi:hypothetical protein